MPREKGVSCGLQCWKIGAANKDEVSTIVVLYFRNHILMRVELKLSCVIGILISSRLPN